MMQASAEAALVERRLQQERKSDGLSGDLRHWQEAAEALHGALERARPALLADGTLMDLCDRAGARLRELKAKSKDLNLDRDLDGCVEQWKALGIELSQLAGRQREPLVRLLQARKGRIDQTTAALAVARKSEGLTPDKYRKVLQLRGERDRALQKYERLRQQYLAAARK